MTRRSLVAATAGTLSLFALTTGLANASTNSLTYRGQYSIPFTTLAACSTASAARNDPPDVYSYPCETVLIGGVTEWHYWYKYLVE